MKEHKPSPVLLILAFAAIYFIWGTTYMANLFGLEGMGPFVLSCIRYIIAGVLLAGWCLIKKLQWPRLSSLKVSAISGIIMLVGGSGLVVFAEQYIYSGYAAVIIATEPLWFVLLDKKRWREYFANRKIIVGLLTGFTGIALFSHVTPSAPHVDNDVNLKILGTLIVLVSAVLWVVGTLYAKSRTQPGSSNVVNTAVQLLAAGLFSAIVAGFTGEWTEFQPQQVPARAWAGLAFLIFMGSLAAYLAFTWLVTVQPPALVSTHTYVNPAVAIFIGWVVANEPIVFYQVVALIIVLAGVLLTTLNRQRLKVQSS